jgi:hypothetical protein
MGQAIILLEIGILAVVLGIVVTRRGHIGAHSRPYSSSRGRLPLGIALILIGVGFTVAGILTL